MQIASHRKRALVLGVVGTAVLLEGYGVWRLRSPAQRDAQDQTPRLIAMGGVTLPALTGWSERFVDGLRADSVFYRKQDAKCNLSITVTWHHGYGKAPHSRNVQDLLKRVRSGLSMTRNLDQKLGLASSSYMQSAPPRLTTYIGVPAVSVQMKTRTDKGKTYDSHGTRFLLDGQEFHVGDSTSYPTDQAPTPQAAAEMKEALQTIEQSFEIAHGFGK